MSPDALRIIKGKAPSLAPLWRVVLGSAGALLAWLVFLTVMVWDNQREQIQIEKNQEQVLRSLAIIEADLEELLAAERARAWGLAPVVPGTPGKRGTP